MKERYFSTFQLIMLALFSALVVVAKVALRLPLQMSGHSGIFWMAIIIVAAGVVPRRGAATLVGLTSGILAAFLGVGDFGALNTLLSYTAVGLGTDLALLLLGDPTHPVMAMLAAVFGHVAKFLVKWGMGVLTGAPVGFVALGLARAAELCDFRRYRRLAGQPHPGGVAQSRILRVHCGEEVMV